MSKTWVHIRFLLKYIPLQLFGVMVNIYGLAFALFFWAVLGYHNFIFVWTLASVMFLPISIILNGWGKLNPLWFMLDDSRYEGGLKAEDYANWLDGRQETFITLWLWHNRNRIYNLASLFKGKDGMEYAVQIKKNTLIFRDHPLELTDDVGFMKYDNFAGLKWINSKGEEGWQVWSGDLISNDYSIFGTMELYHRIETTLYYKYSTCRKIGTLFYKELWMTIKYDANQGIGAIHFKIQWEKD